MWKEAAVAYFKKLSLHLPEEIEKTTRNHHVDNWSPFNIKKAEVLSIVL
jgi:hypothetical protein